MNVTACKPPAVGGIKAVSFDFARASLDWAAYCESKRKFVLPPISLGSEDVFAIPYI